MIERRYIFADEENEYFRRLMRKLKRFTGRRVGIIGRKGIGSVFIGSDMGSGDLQIGTTLFAYSGDLEITTTGKKADGPVRSFSSPLNARRISGVFGACRTDRA